MPIYEFHCEACEGDFEELFRSMSSRPAVACPACGSGEVRRKLSLFGMSSSRRNGVGGSRRSSCASCSAKSCAGCRR